MQPINEQLEKAIELVRHWPSERQQDAVRTILAMHECGTTVYHMTDEEREDIDEGLQQALRGDQVDPKIMEDFFRSHGLCK